MNKKTSKTPEKRKPNNQNDKKKQNLSRSRFFNDISSISNSGSFRRATTPINNRAKMEETSEERDALTCTFRPKIDKNSAKLFAKRNTRKKPVVERLMDYNEYQKLVMQERIASSYPTFTPDLSKGKHEIGRAHV